MSYTNLGRSAVATGDILCRDNTLWVQGVAAIGILLFHFLTQLDGMPRVVNIFGAVGVAAFLFVSGFGLNESYKVRHSLEGFWRRRFVRVILPCWVIFLFRLPFETDFDAMQLLRDMTFTGSDLWYVDFILSWYLVFWIAKRFAGRYAVWVLAVYAVCCMFMSSLRSGQSLSFFMGYMVSEYYDRLRALPRRVTVKCLLAIVAWGMFFYLLKLFPFLQEMKGTLPFNLVLMNIMLPLSMGWFLLAWLLPWVKRARPVIWAGKAGYEIYIVHWSFMPFVDNSMLNVVLFTVLSLLISAVLYRVDVRLRQRGVFLQTLSVVLLCAVGYLMLLKYAARVTEWYGAIGLCYALMLALVAIWLCGLPGRKDTVSAALSGHGRWLAVGFTLTLAVMYIAVQYSLDPLQNNVDRWSAIHNCLTALFDGSFPYEASTHLGGKASPFPVWMVCHIPFWLLGNVGLSEVVTAIIFLFSVKLLAGWRGTAVAAVLLLLNINVWYEVAVRSDLISNFLLLAAFVNVVHAKGIRFERYPYWLAACGGLWLSTRLSVALPLCVLWLPDWWRLSLCKKVGSLMVGVLVFCLTFAPLALWNADSLFHSEYTPFVLQTRQGMPGDVPLMLLVAVVMAFVHHGDTVRMLFGCAFVSLAVPAISFVHRMAVRGDWMEVFSSYYDITYFDAALPFLITCVCVAMNESGKQQSRNVVL